MHQGCTSVKNFNRRCPFPDVNWLLNTSSERLDAASAPRTPVAVQDAALLAGVPGDHIFDRGSEWELSNPYELLEVVPVHMRAEDVIVSVG